jgi:hypothetical protein
VVVVLGEVPPLMQRSDHGLTLQGRHQCQRCASNRQWDRPAQVPYGNRVGMVGDSMSVIAARAISYLPRLR